MGILGLEYQYNSVLLFILLFMLRLYSQLLGSHTISPRCFYDYDHMQFCTGQLITANITDDGLDTERWHL